MMFMGFYLLFGFTSLRASVSLWHVGGAMAGVMVMTLIILYIWAWISYYFYRYELAENALKEEFGVVWKSYVSIPYDRIQNVDIYRGIFARILGISDVHIQTAGMSGSPPGASGGYTEGRLPGLGREMAEKLRDDLINRSRKSKDQGL